MSGWIRAATRLLVCAMWPWVASAQIPDASLRDDPIALTADSIEYESARRIYVARGNVRIVSGETELTADWVAFSDVRQRGVATGDVEYRVGGDVLTAEFAEFNVDTERGLLFVADFHSDENQFRMHGDEVVKRGDDTYSFEGGSFTTCRCPDDGEDPWRIEAESADLEVGGYGTARNTTFEILGVPVIWLPWMIYPLKTERESGVLLPEFSYGNRNGVDIGLPIFWAAGDQVNVILTPRWLSERGGKGDLEVEYVFGERSAGEVSGSFIYDQKIEPYSNEDPYGRERWQVHGLQDVFLPFEARLKSDFQFISDNEYLVDFNDLHDSRNDRFLESNAFLYDDFGADGRFGLHALALYADDLQNPTNQDRDKVLLQRLPTLEADALPAALVSVPLLDRVLPSLDTEYTYFVPRRRAIDKYNDLDPSYYRSNAFIDTGIDGIPTPREQGYDPILDPDPNRDDFTTAGGPEANGSFEEGELLSDEGHRIDLYPRLAVPFRVADVAEVYPEVGWHQTFYDTRLQGSEERHLLTARVDLRSRLRRRFDSGIVHLIEPRIGYALVTDLGTNQWSRPLFVPATAVPQRRIRQLALGNVTYDPADRVSAFNGVTYGVANRIYRNDPETPPRLLADFYLSNEFAINGNAFGNIFVGGRAYPIEGAHVWANLGFNPNHARISEALFQLAYHARAGHRVALSYRYLRDVPRFFEDFNNSSQRFDEFSNDFKRIHQIGFFGKLVLTSQWAVHTRVAYSFEDSLLLVTRGGVEYTSKCRCWAGGFEVSYDRTRGFRFDLVYRLLGLGRDAGPRGPDEARLSDLGLLDGF